MSADKETIPSPMCEVAAAIVYVVLEARSPNTGFNRLSNADALYNVLNYELVASAEITREFFQVANSIKEIKKNLELDAIVYDDYNPTMTSTTLVMASQYSLDQLNEGLRLICSPYFKVHFKRKSRNLRALFSYEETE